MTTARDHLSKVDTVTIAAIEANLPTLVEARTFIDRFHLMIRKKIEVELDPWITDAGPSLIASLATGIKKDKDSVRAAIIEPWSNGQTEGQITKLKLVKRQMYGRAKLDLLQARLIGSARATQPQSGVCQSHYCRQIYISIQCATRHGCTPRVRWNV